MLEFEWPWLALLFPLPLLIRWFFSTQESSLQAALKVSFLEEFVEIGESQHKIDSKIWPWAIAFIAWFLLVFASMRPLWLGELIDVPVSGRDLMLAVDLSGSMEQSDFYLKGQRVDRLSATKAVATEFIQQRIGDRIGLILFGEKAYLQTPLTFDRATVSRLLSESAIGLAGQKTAIGDAIGLAVKRLRQRDAENRVLILLTDGANTAGEVEPLTAADLAAKEGLTIYSIGIGAEEMLVRDFFGSRRVNPSTDLDEKTLTAIAKKTGGEYFRARNTDELNQIYTIIDKLEPIEDEPERYRPQQSLYYWPLSIAFLLASILFLSRLMGFVR